MILRIQLLLLSTLLTTALFAQRGIDGSLNVTTNNTVVNAYTPLGLDVTAGATTITVNDAMALTGGLGTITGGSLIFIYQAQGATGTGATNGTTALPNDITWGSVTAYGNSGNYEFAQVESVAGNVLTLTCALVNDYDVAGSTQIVRVPRYTDLSITGLGSITAIDWDGSIGGLVLVEVDGNLVIDVSNGITANGNGFRGGQLDVLSTTSADWASTLGASGAEKGESILGDQVAYDALGGRYGRAAAANGGGGGNANKAGGGGGGNAATMPLAGYTGTGVADISDPTWIPAWNLEVPPIGSVAANSVGGGRGGYSRSTMDNDATVLGPNQAAWGGDSRSSTGGMGGRPLDYTLGKVFFGGGGGAGDQDNAADGGGGGSGGGFVFVRCYGNISGTGSISANGIPGESTDSLGAAMGAIAGSAGAGGGGAGGSILIQCDGTVTGINAFARGGNGGNHLIAAGAMATVAEAEGPGGGGSGGYIASNVVLTSDAIGGAGGVTSSDQLSEFPITEQPVGRQETQHPCFQMYS